MNTKKRALILVLFFISVCWTCKLNATESTFRLSFDEYYAYERAKSLDLEVSEPEETRKYEVRKVEYTSVWGKRVPSLYMVPKTGTPPYPCVVIGHGFTGSKKDFVFAFDDFADAGIAVFSIDMWYHGDRKVEGTEMYSPYLYKMREGLSASVIDFRRAIDFLEERDEIDAERIGYIGGSMGGIIGGLLGGVEDRLKTVVLAVGGGDWSYLIKHSVVTQAVLSNNRGDIKEFSKAAARILAPSDPINTVQMIAPRPLLMLNAKHDILVNPLSNKKLFARAGIPKKIIWFESGHELPMEDAFIVIRDWMEKYLVKGETPDFDSRNTGYNTAPLPIEDSYSAPLIDSISYAEYFSYNGEAPLLSTRADIAHESGEGFSFTFVGVHEKKVHGEVYLPNVGEPPYHCAIFIHGLKGSAADSELVRSMLLRNGIAIAAIEGFTFNGKSEGDVAGPYELRNLVVQTAFDNFRLMDMLDKFEETASGGYTLIGAAEGTAVTAIAAAADERVMNIIQLNPVSLADIAEEAAAGPQVREGVEYTKEKIDKALEVVNAEKFADAMPAMPALVIWAPASSETSRAAMEAIYGKMKEPKEKLEISEAGARTIAETLKGILIFIRNSAHMMDADTGEAHSNIFIDPGWADVEHEDGEEGAPKNELQFDHLFVYQNEKGGKIELEIKAKSNHAVIQPGATIIAAALDDTKTLGFVQLSDNGKGADSAAADGEFTGILLLPEDAGVIKVKVGGVSPAGETIRDSVEEVDAK